MNKVITINLNGIAYQLEEGGYEALRNYLESASAKLAGNPDKDEIIADIEQAIGDKFRLLLGTHKNVVTARETEGVLRELGPIDDGSARQEGAGPDGAGTDSTAKAAGAPAGGPAQAGVKKPRRLYRLNEDAMLFGVCSGLEAFTGWPAILFRIGFVILTLGTWGVGVLIYAALVILVPLADTATERAEAQGPSPTAQDFIRRAKEGYYEAMKGFPDREARREWKRRFKQDMKAWRRSFRWEMNSNSAQCRQNWENFWAARAPRWRPQSWGLLMLCSMADFVLFILLLCGIFSLVKHGALFGLALPADIPLWVGILLFCVFVGMLSIPIKFLRYIGSGGCSCRNHSGFGGFLMLCALLFGLAWLIHPQKTKSVIDEIPPTIHKAVDSVKEWWDRR